MNINIKTAIINPNPEILSEVPELEYLENPEPEAANIQIEMVTTPVERNVKE